MDNIKKNKSLISIIVFLLITNLAMLIFFVFVNGPADKSSPGENQGRFSKALQKDVGFTKEQFDQYQALRKTHFEKLRPLFNEVRNAKFGLYDLLYAGPVSDSIINSKAEMIGEKQELLDIQMFRHFERSRKICTQEQLPKFDTAIKQLIMRMTERPGKSSHEHH
ncbi:MAG: hypothetical protein ABJA90_05620 [Ginsengibacter sp.]